MNSGKQIEYRIEDEPSATKHFATVIQEKEIDQDETEEYIAEAIQLKDDDPNSGGKIIKFLLGTDSEYYLDGKRVIFLNDARP